MNVAVIQFNAINDKSDNLRRATELVSQAADHGATFILLPEVFNFRGLLTSYDVLQKIAEDIPGPSSHPFLAIAKEKNVTILLGSIYERIENSQKVFNTSILISPRGELQSIYRKIHLFDAIVGDKVVKESNFFDAGNKAVLTKVDDFTVGLSVCYDLRFGGLYYQYAQNGAQILCVPSAFTKKTGAAHWHTLVKARAIENLCYVLAPNQIGSDGRGIETFGHSLIVSPWGEILAEASADQEEIIYASISQEALQEARQKLPGIVKSQQ